MNATVEEKPKSAPAEKETPNPITLLERLFPSRPSEFKRDIRPLWDNRYRVNFWVEDPNLISRSYFVIVENDDVSAYIKDDLIFVGEPIE